LHYLQFLGHLWYNMACMNIYNNTFNFLQTIILHGKGLWNTFICYTNILMMVRNDCIHLMYTNTFLNFKWEWMLKWTKIIESMLSLNENIEWHYMHLELNWIAFKWIEFQFNNWTNIQFNWIQIQLKRNLK